MATLEPRRTALAQQSNVRNFNGRAMGVRTNHLGGSAMLSPRDQGFGTKRECAPTIPLFFTSHGKSKDTSSNMTDYQAKFGHT